MLFHLSRQRRRLLMPSGFKRASTTATLIILSGALGGCVTGAGVSYSEYQYDRYGGTERTYERNVYSDPAYGVESERCRTVVRRRINAVGEEVVRRDRVCGPTDEITPAEPWERQVTPQNVYPGPAEPPEDVPYID
jgi:hypothetical protein